LNTLNQNHLRLAGLIFFAFLFSFAVRLIWVYQFSDYESFKFAGQLMINTNDGYYWAEGARDLLSGVHQKFDLSPIDQAPAQLTYLLAKILPVSFETLIFYMPALIGSLIVIPIILIAYNLAIVEVGFLAVSLSVYCRELLQSNDDRILRYGYAYNRIAYLFAVVTHIGFANQRRKVSSYYGFGDYCLPLVVSSELFA